MKLFALVIAFVAIAVACPAAGGAKKGAAVCLNVGARCRISSQCCSVTCGPDNTCHWHPTVVALRNQITEVQRQGAEFTQKLQSQDLLVCMRSRNMAQGHATRIRGELPGLVTEVRQARSTECPTCPPSEEKQIKVWRPAACPVCQQTSDKVVFVPEVCPNIQCPQCGQGQQVVSGGGTDDLALFDEDDVDEDDDDEQEKRRFRAPPAPAGPAPWQIAITQARAQLNQVTAVTAALKARYDAWQQQLDQCQADLKTWTDRLEAARTRLARARDGLQAATHKQCPALSCQRWKIVRQYEDRACAECKPSHTVVRRSCPGQEICKACPVQQQLPKLIQLPAPTEIAPKGGDVPAAKGGDFAPVDVAPPAKGGDMAPVDVVAAPVAKGGDAAPVDVVAAPVAKGGDALVDAPIDTVVSPKGQEQQQQQVVADEPLYYY